MQERWKPEEEMKGTGKKGHLYYGTDRDDKIERQNDK
jgi:hypothetical protein